MNTYQILIVISLLIIFSYLFDLFAKKTQFPSILLLLITGASIKYASIYLNFPLIDFTTLLPILGNIGLILIILEGGLELEYNKEKRSVIKNALGAAFFPMLFTIGFIAALFHYYFKADIHTALLNAIPFAIISSAIAIPSAAGLAMHKKEFIIYESSFSDIIGIVLFNFVLLNSSLTFSSVGGLGLEIIIILIVSILCSLVILFLLKKITMHIKYHLLFAVTLLVYAIGKYFHLSSLLVVLVVGLFLKNAALFNFNWFKNNFLYSKLDEDIHQMTSFTAESAFLIRTFFFLIFGYTLDLKELLDNEILMTGAGIFSIIFSIRFIYLKLISKSELLPEGFISPRGLISILLFYTIPTEKWISTKENGMLLSVIIATSIFMTLGLLIYKRKTTLA